MKLSHATSLLTGTLLAAASCGCEALQRPWHSEMPLPRHAEIVRRTFPVGLPLAEVESRADALRAKPGALRRGSAAAVNPEARGRHVLPVLVLGPSRLPNADQRRFDFFFDPDQRLTEIWYEPRPEELAAAQADIGGQPAGPLEGVWLVPGPDGPRVRAVRLVPASERIDRMIREAPELAAGAEDSR